MRTFAWRLGSLIVLAVAIAAWGEIAALKLIPPLFLPSPARAFNALIAGFSHGDLLGKLEGTLTHMAIGWVVGLARRRCARRDDRRLGAGARLCGTDARIPAPAAGFRGHPRSDRDLRVDAGDGDWRHRIRLDLADAARDRPRLRPCRARLAEVARALQMSRLSVVWKIALPSALPDILAGLRLGLTVALILAVVCEMIGGIDGLGQWELVAARAYRSADIFAGVILLGLRGSSPIRR